MRRLRAAIVCMPSIGSYPASQADRLHTASPLLVSPFPEGVVCIYIGQRVHLYEVVAPRRDKS